MSLNELASAQPVEEVATPSEPENVTPIVEDNSDATSVNADAQGNEDDKHPGFQKRINQVLQQKREVEEKLIAANAAKEALENNMDHFSAQQDSEKKLSDLDASQLKEFIAKARGDEELEIHIPEAQEYLVDRQVEERLNKFEKTKSTQDLQTEGQNMTNIMLNNLAGERLSDSESEYFQTVQGNLYELEQPKFQHVNKDQLIAVLLTEVDLLKASANGPTLPEKVVTNRNNTIMANNRSISTGGTGVKDFLSENQRLTKNQQGKKGTLNAVIKQLGSVQSLKGG